MKGKFRYQIGTVGVVLIAFVIYISTRRRSFERVIGRFPYVRNPSIDIPLDGYLSTMPARGSLVLMGPPQIGKRRAMEERAKDLSDHGSFVVFIDSDSAYDLDSVIGLFRSSLIHAFRTLPYSTQKQIADRVAESSEESALERFSRVVEDTSEPSAFWDIINAASLVTKSFVFVSHVKSNLEFYHHFFQQFSANAVYESNIHLVTDYKILAISPYYANAEPLNDPTNDLVVRSHVFSALEMRLILKEFGGYPALIERVYEDLKAGINITTSISNLKNTLDRNLEEAKSIASNYPEGEMLLEFGCKRVNMSSRGFSEKVFIDRNIVYSYGYAFRYDMVNEYYRRTACNQTDIEEPTTPEESK